MDETHNNVAASHNFSNTGAEKHSTVDHHHSCTYGHRGIAVQHSRPHCKPGDSRHGSQGHPCYSWPYASLVLAPDLSQTLEPRYRHTSVPISAICPISNCTQTDFHCPNRHKPSQTVTNVGLPQSLY